MATNHLLQSNCIFFLFDPFKDFRTLDNCSSEDPQAGVMKRTANQMQVFNEMVNRIHQKPDLSSDEPYPIPLVVVIPKYDAWKHTFGLDLAETSVIGMGKGQRPALDMSVVTLTSFLLRDWLLKLVPELVAGAEASFKEVYYLPASALGKAPMLDSQTRMLGVQPSDVQPVWADVPLLFYLWHAGFLPGIRSSVSDEVRPADEFCRFENGVMFFLPPRRKSMIVPRIYWGQVVHDDELGFIRFPSDAGTDAEEMDEELSF